MRKYKYISERPAIGHQISEKLMDFEEIKIRVNNTRQNRLIRNTTLLTIGLALIAFTVFFYSNNENPEHNVRQDAGPINDKTEINDSLKNTFEDNKQLLVENSDPIEDSPEKSTRKKQPVLQDEKSSQEESPNSFKKIEESLPPKQEFVQAVPLNGFEELFEYFGNNMPYPDSLKIKGVEGTVVVEFSVTKNGQIEKARIIESIHPVLDSIALSAVKNMPEWKPATLNGQPFETKHSIPLIFQIENE